MLKMQSCMHEVELKDGSPHNIASSNRLLMVMYVLS